MVLQQLHSVQVPTPAGPVHSGAVQLGAQSHGEGYPHPVSVPPTQLVPVSGLTPVRPLPTTTSGPGTPPVPFLWLCHARRLRPSQSQGQDPPSPGP